MPSGRLFIASDSRPKLTIMKARVPTVGQGLEKPSDIFIRKAQTTSSRPARKRKIQAMTSPLHGVPGRPGVMPTKGEVVL
ncbi:hypothetical protein D3C72_2477210 [compost metagenome]